MSSSELELAQLPLPPVTNPLTQTGAGISSATNGSNNDKIWVFVYVNESREECTKLFRERGKCEQFAVDYLAQVYSYHFQPTGQLTHDLTVLHNIWLTSDERDYWYIKECSVTA